MPLLTGSKASTGPACRSTAARTGWGRVAKSMRTDPTVASATDALALRHSTYR
jgi:hypothetical protein